MTISADILNAIRADSPFRADAPDSPGERNRSRAEAVNDVMAVYALANAEQAWDRMSAAERSEIRRDLMTDLLHHADGDDADGLYEVEQSRERYAEETEEERRAVDNGAQHKCRACNYWVDESKLWWQKCARCAEQSPAPRPWVYTVTVAGPECEMGAAPTTYVLHAADQDAAIAEAIRVHCDDGSPGPVEVVDEETHRGGPRANYGIYDLRE